MSHIQGWYPDPEDPRYLRWWDGSSWTAQRHPREGLQPQNATPATAKITSHQPKRALVFTLFGAALVMVIAAVSIAAWAYILNREGQELSGRIEEASSQQEKLQTELDQLTDEVTELETQLGVQR